MGVNATSTEYTHQLLNEILKLHMTQALEDLNTPSALYCLLAGKHQEFPRKPKRCKRREV